jgi:hypothetical protein
MNVKLNRSPKAEEFQKNSHFNGKNHILSVAYPQEDFLFKILHSASLIKKYIHYLKRGYPAEFAVST